MWWNACGIRKRGFHISIGSCILPDFKVDKSCTHSLLQIIPGPSWINSHFCPFAALHLSEKNMKCISSASLEKYNAFQCSWIRRYLCLGSLLFMNSDENIQCIEKLVSPNGRTLCNCLNYLHSFNLYKNQSKRQKMHKKNIATTLCLRSGGFGVFIGENASVRWCFRLTEGTETAAD